MIRRQLLMLSFFIFAIAGLFAQTDPCDFFLPKPLLEREYKEFPLCQTHGQRKIQKYYPDFIEFLPLIPSSHVRCYKVDCPICHEVWIEEYFMYEDEEGEWFAPYWNCDCKEDYHDYKGGSGYQEWWHTWKRCEKGGIYPGYFEFSYFKYISFFKRYLQHLREHSSCQCFWPENSPLAANINNTAYNLFRDLIKNTALSILIDDFDQQNAFLCTKVETLNPHGVTIVFICHSFFYSDYETICRELEAYSEQTFDRTSHRKIRKAIDNIREALYPLFLELYDSCLAKHPHPLIQQEKAYIYTHLLGKSFLENSFEASIEPTHQNIPYHSLTSSHLIARKASFEPQDLPCSLSEQKESPESLYLLSNQKNPSDPFHSDVYLGQGVVYNDALLYEHAINALTESIRLNPRNREAYIERSLAYFEMKLLDLAIQDWLKAKELTFAYSPDRNQPEFDWRNLSFHNDFNASLEFDPKEHWDYAKGLTEGALKGVQVGTVEFVPSVLSSLRGISLGLWAFAQAPKSTSRQLINDSYELILFLQEHSKEEIAQEVIPELKELVAKWDTLNDFERGHGIGFIIGKYGVDIFAGSQSVKCIQRYRALKRANAMFTVESCTYSAATREKIIIEAVRKAQWRATLFENGKIKIHWDKQNKHIPGSHNYEPGKSKITTSREKLEKLLREKVGHGEAVNRESFGTSSYKERIDFGELIGEFAHMKGNDIIKIEPTTKGIVHFDKEGYFHMVPCRN